MVRYDMSVSSLFVSLIKESVLIMKYLLIYYFHFSESCKLSFPMHLPKFMKFFLSTFYRFVRGRVY